MEITKLQDIANQVALDSVSSNRQLRNEEIRRRMYGDWSPPTETSTQPTTIQDTSKNYEGGDATLASTYSKLLNNYNVATNSKPDTSSGTYTGNLSSYAPLAVSTGLTLSGYGRYAPIANTAIKLMQGDRAGAAGTMTSMLTNKLTGGQIPGLGGLIGTLASGIIGDKSNEEIGQGLLNSGIGTAIGVANPIAGVAYNLLRGIGFDPAYGLNNLFGSGLQGVAPGYEGTLGGFFGKNALGSGISNSGSSNPAGYGSGDLGSGISNTNTGTGLGYSPGTLGTGITGGLTNSFGEYSTSDSGYSYSNPAASYGGWSASSSSSDSGGD